jgi:hypothetical protein
MDHDNGDSASEIKQTMDVEISNPDLEVSALYPSQCESSAIYPTQFRVSAVYPTHSEEMLFIQRNLEVVLLIHQLKNLQNKCC